MSSKGHIPVKQPHHEQKGSDSRKVLTNITNQQSAGWKTPHLNIFKKGSQSPVETLPPKVTAPPLNSLVNVIRNLVGEGTLSIPHNLPVFDEDSEYDMTIFDNEADLFSSAITPTSKSASAAKTEVMNTAATNAKAFEVDPTDGLETVTLDDVSPIKPRRLSFSGS